jgi:GTPase SAR1 family protein
MRIKEIIRIVKPEYTFLKLTPNNSIRNNSTDKIAKAIASLYRSIKSNIKKDEVKIVKKFGREFLIGTKYSFQTPVKVSYFIYLEKKKAEFYFILPKQYESVIHEKISDAWSGITIKEAESFPIFNPTSTKYQLVYTKEDPMSLDADRRDNELIQSNLSVIDVMEEQDRMGIFYNFIPVSQFSWKSTYRNTMTKIKKGDPVDRNKLGLSYIFLFIISKLNVLSNDLGEVVGGKTKKKDDQSGFDRLIERMNGRSDISGSTSKKLTDTILDTQIIVMSESPDELREQNNAKSLAQSFDSISGDNSLKHKSFKGNFNPATLRINGAEVNKVSSRECQNFISLPGRELLEQYNFVEKIETHETEVPADLQQGVMRIGSNRYRGKDQTAYISNDSEYKNLTLVLIGPARAGKTTLLGNLSRDAIAAGECVLIFDYIKNCELSSEVAALFPKEKIKVIECSDPSTIQGLGYNEVGVSSDPFEQYDNAKKQTTQMLTLINSINADDTPLSAKMERYLTGASLAVFILGGSIRDVFNVLQDHKVRYDFIDRIPESQQENLHEYIQSLYELDDYREVKIKEDGVTRSYPELAGTKEHLVSGVIDRLNKLKANTYMEMMLKKSTEHNIDLVNELQKNQLLCIKMPETMFSTDGERDIYTTYWLTKLWLALQIRGQRIPDRKKLTKVNFFFDELYQVKTTEKLLTEKLSRLAKFAAKPIISCHYLNQISYIRDELRSANASYMLISGCDKKNYKELKDELYPYEIEDLLRLPRFHSLNLIKHTEGYARFITHLPKPI